MSHSVCHFVAIQTPGVERGVGLVVSGHWGTEHAIADVLAARISAAFPQLTVAHAESDKDPYSYLL